MFSIVTKHDYDRLVDFYHKAINTPSIARFMSTSMHREIPEPDVDWSTLTYINADNTALMRLSPARVVNNHWSNLGLWVLDPPNQKYAAGKLFKIAVHEARTRYNSKFLNWEVHGTNELSLTFSRKTGANEYGHEPEGAWDSAGYWTTNHMFKLDVYEYVNQHGRL